MSALTVPAIERLRLEPGDILVVRCASRQDYDDMRPQFDTLRRVVAVATGDDDYPIVVCIGDVRLERLPESEVRALGWVRP